MVTTSTLTRLFYYPVKSTQGIETRAAPVSAAGLEHDRRWMVVDSENRFLTQRTHPHMARIVPAVRGGELTLTAPGLPELHVAASQGGAGITVTIWDDTCRALTQGEEADAWVTRALEEPARLVKVTPGMGRTASTEYAQEVAAPLGFPDGYPILLCSESSLADLNMRLPAAMPIERFRPNLVLAGLPPWAEDRIERVTVGAVTLRLVKPCTRCSIPTFDHLTGEPAFNVLRVLKEFRFNHALHGVTFGENAVVESGAGNTLAAGSHCEITYRS